MKRFFALLLSALLILSLAACGSKEATDAPLKRDAGASNPASQAGEESAPAASSPSTPAPSADIGEIDVGSIMAGTGDTDVIWGKQDEATKQAIIADAKADGLDISFGADDCMTIVDPGSGETYLQNPDGTWMIQNEGGEAQIGGSWPDNEFTALVPKPDFTLTATNSESDFFSAVISGATIEQIRDYSEKVKAKGFTIDAQSEDQEVMGMVVFSYIASNADGYCIEIVSTPGTSSITISK